MRRTPRTILKLKGTDSFLMTREELIQAVAKFCEQLRGALPSEESNAGWTESNKASLLELFLKLENDLRCKNDVPYLSIARNLDFWGIDGGTFAERAYEIGISLNNRKCEPNACILP